MPIIFGKTPKKEQLDFQYTYLKRSLDLMERWLTENTYLCGSQITIADVSAACELSQTRALQLDLNKWPKVQEWQKKMIEETPEI